jgi:hypothetical protein
MVKDIIEELDAKAWQSTRWNKGKRPADHVCHRAAREIERLRAIADAPAADKGWRTFWHAFCDHLDLHRSQRVYGWHELMDGCKNGMAAVERATKPLPPSPALQDQQ